MDLELQPTASTSSPEAPAGSAARPPTAWSPRAPGWCSPAAARRRCAAAARRSATRRSTVVADNADPATPGRLIARPRGALGPPRRRPDQRRRPAQGPGHRHHRRAVDARPSSRCSSARCGCAARSGRRCRRGGSLALRALLERAGAAGRHGDLQRAAPGPGDGRQDPRRRARPARASGSTACCPAGSAPSGSPSWTRRPATPRRRARPRSRTIPLGRYGEPGGVRPGGGLPALAGRVVRVRRDAAGRRRDAPRALSPRSRARRRTPLVGRPHRLLVGVLGGALLLALGQRLARATDVSPRLAERHSSYSEVAEAEDREHAEEPPLQPVEEVRPVVELGQLDRLERAGRLAVLRASGPRSRRTPRWSRAGADLARWRSPGWSGR